MFRQDWADILLSALFIRFSYLRGLANYFFV